MRNNNSKLSLRFNYTQKIFFVQQLSKILFYKTMSFTDLGRKCNLAPSTISRMYKHKDFTPETSKKILKGLGMSMDEVLKFTLPGMVEDMF
jgi:predicted transcriptional regulator